MKQPENTIPDSPSDHFTVAAVLLKQPSQNRWIDVSWRLLGLLPGLSKEALAKAEADGELVYFADRVLTLYTQHCDAYYLNLMADHPKVYLVCESDHEQLKPILLTVDYDEAASYMETGELVLDAPLPDELCVWMERFVIAHYTPEKPKKRKRKQWHDEEDDLS